MDEVKNLVVTTLQSAGGTMPYAALYEAIPFEKRRNLRRVLLSLKGEGLITKQVALGENGIDHTVSLVGGS